MKILLAADFPDDPTLGSAKVLYKLREEFQRQGHACDALFAGDLGASPRQRHARDLMGPVLTAAAIARAVRERGQYDVIDVAGAEGAAFAALRRTGTVRSAALVSRSNGLEHLNYARMLDDADAGVSSKPWHRRLWYPAVRLRQVRRAIESCDRLILINEGDRDYVLAQRWKAPDAIDVVPHGVSERFLNAAPPGSPRGEGVLFCGSWDAMKGVQYLAAAWADLAADPQPPRLTVLGGGRRSGAILADFDPTARRLVTVRDRVPEEEVMRHYRRHDVLVMCSTYEGFSLVVPEAMSQGLPVIATPVGVAPALLRHGETGLIVPSRNPAALAGAIRQLLPDSALRAKLASSAIRAVQGLTWNATARRTLEAYERACGVVRAA
ncbi:MAG TPA: glycosyltransferase family 4 protein [Vicinamibacterales bacterium]|nr:glycosyltransferase family 4 protein [Vicinamibacterales bacterium]